MRLGGCRAAFEVGSGVGGREGGAGEEGEGFDLDALLKLRWWWGC